MKSAVDLTTFFAALRAFCARNGNAVRLARAARVGQCAVSRLRRGNTRGVSFASLARLASALATLPYIPEEFAPGARDTLAPDEFAYLRERLARARSVYSRAHILDAGASDSQFDNAMRDIRPRASRAAADRIHRALDSLSVPRDPACEQRPDVPQHLRDAVRRLALQLTQEETTQ